MATLFKLVSVAGGFSAGPLERWQALRECGHHSRGMSGVRCTFAAFLVVLLVFVIGCGDEEVQPTPVSYDDPTDGYGPPDFDQRHKAAKADSFHATPRIMKVEWKTHGTCSTNRITRVDLNVEVTDSDTDASDLRFEGAITGCNAGNGNFGPMITHAHSQLRCHHVSAHIGLVTVVDPQGNGDSFAFRFGPCSAGSATPQGD